MFPLKHKIFFTIQRYSFLSILLRNIYVAHKNNYICNLL